MAFKCATTGRFAAAVGFHPSLVVNTFQQAPHNTSEEAFGRAVQCPLLALPAGNDDATVKPGGVFLELVRERFPASRSVEFPEMQHGWVSRGTEPDCVAVQKCSQEAVSEAQRSALEEAAAFLRRALAADA